MEYRLATIDDAGLLFDWANDPVTRSNSFSSEPIVWEEHLAWLKRKLADNDSKLCIVSDGQNPCGTFRLDLENAAASGAVDKKIIISYSLAPDSRGKGLGSRLLELAEEAGIEFFGGGMLVGEVKPDNTASKKCFLKCGYTDSSSGTGEFVFTKMVGN